MAVSEPTREQIEAELRRAAAQPNSGVPLPYIGNPPAAAPVSIPGGAFSNAPPAARPQPVAVAPLEQRIQGALTGPQAASTPAQPLTPEQAALQQRYGNAFEAAAPQQASPRIMLAAPGSPQQPGTAALPLPPMGGGGGPVRVIPGKRTPQSWATTTERGVQLDPETAARYRAAEDEAQAALNLRGEAALETNAYMKGEGLRQQGERAREWVDDKNRQEARDQQMVDAQAKVAAARNIDPNRLWAKGDGFNHAMDLVGAIAGGILVGMGRTPTNQYLDKLERDASNDVQLQLKDLENAEADVKAYYGQWEREDQRIAAGRLAKMQDAKDRISNMLSGSQDKRVQAELLEAQAALDRKMADDRKTLLKETQGRTVEQRNDVMTKPQMVGGGGGGRDWMRTVAALPPDKLKDFWASYKLNAETPGMSKDKAMEATVRQYNLNGGISLPGKDSGGPVAPGDPSLFIPGAFNGQGGYARTPKDAEELRNGITAANTMVRNLRRIQELRNESVMNRLSPSAKAELELLVSDNITKRKETEKLGVLAGPDLDIVKPFAGANALDIVSPGADRQLAVAISTIENAAANRLRDYGVVPGSEVTRGGQLQGRVTGTSAPVVAPGTTPFKKAGTE